MQRFFLTLHAMLLLILIRTELTFSANSVSFANNQMSASETIRISFSGDIIIHDELYKAVLNHPNHDFSSIWNKTNPLFAKADFSYANLEGPTAVGIDNKLRNVGDVGFTYDRVVYSGTNLLFNFHPKLIDDLKKSGIDIVSLANNHSYDRGSKGINKTIDEMLKRDFPFIGVRKSASKEPIYTTTKIKNFNVAWVACTEALNGFKDKHYQLLFCFEQKEEVLKLIQDLASNPDIDFVIVTPHWGLEYKDKPTEKQKQLAHEMLDAGAIAIIGSHPHVLQPVEKYITKNNRETFIAYSLGNFVAYQRNIERKSSAVIYLDFAKAKNQKAVITKFSYLPITRSLREIFPADKNKDVIKHVEKYLGPFEKQPY